MNGDRGGINLSRDPGFGTYVAEIGREAVAQVDSGVSQTPLLEIDTLSESRLRIEVRGQ